MRLILLLILLGAMPVEWALGAADTATPAQRSAAEIEAIINKAGTSAPDWWEKVQANPPKTLELTWTRPAGKEWVPNKYLGHYVWSVINENPSKWRSGAKLIFQTLEVNKNDKEKLRMSMGALARIYHHLLKDYARAAFWLRKADSQDEDSSPSAMLAECYWKLGSKAMAVELLKKMGGDDTRHGSVIKLWADMGELETALKVANAKAADKADIAYLMAGDACRLHGRYKEAVDYYQKVLDATDGGRDIKQSKERAKASMEAVKVFDMLDLKKVADGTYTASSYGYSGQVNVNVVVKAGRIDAVTVGAHQEKQYYGSIEETPKQIIAKQHVKGVDTFSSATITSEAIINSTAKALSKGMK